MCHDLSTAEKFYIALPEWDDAYETRQLHLKALHLESKKRKAPPKALRKKLFEIPSDTTSSEEDDEPDSNSSPSSEELMMIREKRSCSRKKLCFSPVHQSPEKEPQVHVYSPVKEPVVHIYSPSNITVELERIQESIQQYYYNNWRVTVDVQREDGSQSPKKGGSRSPTPASRPTHASRLRHASCPRTVRQKKCTTTPSQHLFFHDYVELSMIM